MFRFFLSFIVAFFMSAVALADDIGLPDQSAMQATISAQLEAFKKDDGAVAYSFAAPIVKNIFPTAEIFMTMVKRGYEPVFRNNTYRFTELATDGFGRPLQHVIISASDGRRYEALYAMQKMDDGSWKIAGVQIVEIPSVDA